MGEGVVWMTTALITLVCVLISALIFERSYRMAMRVVSLKHRVNVLEDSYREATEHIAEIEKLNEVLKQEIDFMRRSAEVQEHRDRPRSWNPSDPFNVGVRERG